MEKQLDIGLLLLLILESSSLFVCSPSPVHRHSPRFEMKVVGAVHPYNTVKHLVGKKMDGTWVVSGIGHSSQWKHRGFYKQW